MKLKRIAILTRDCAGINAAIRAVVRSASGSGIEIVGIRRGYAGLIDADLVALDRQSVSGIISRGGTILKTARAPQFKRKTAQLQAVKTLTDNRIDGLIVIGGNGSLTAANILANRYKIRVVGIPATIDNDINGVPMAIGADTAVNVALDALDKIRDTATSLERIFVVEVMGRDCGYIALRVALAGGCEEVIIPEQEFSLKKMCKEIIEGNRLGKVSWIIVVAEGKAKAPVLARKITGLTGLETRELVLGHIQRGGSPTAFDRMLAAHYGYYAVQALKNGHSACCVTLKNDQPVLIPLRTAIQHKNIEVRKYYSLVKLLT